MRFRAAMHQALYGPEGFYVRNRPGRHFRTSAQSPLFAHALARLVVQVDAALGQPSTLDLVDVGAGEGELLTNLLAALPDDLRARVNAVAVELTTSFEPRHAVEHDLKHMINWKGGVVEAGVTGVLMATEWLDNVPLDLARDGRYLDDGAPLEPLDAQWIERWWPSPAPGRIVEIGRSRDEAWAAAVTKLDAGLALAVDYGHLMGTRPAHPTLAGFSGGREVEPLLDGSTDITCHVAMDSAGSAASSRYSLKRQRDALKELGVDGGRPPLELAHNDPAGYVRALAEASEAAMLLDPDGLGGHWWLSHEIGIRLSE